MPTTKLNLPLIDGSNTADVVRDMNALANAVDNKAGASDGLATLDASGKVPASQLNVSAPPDATTTQKGVVQLSNSTTSTSETLAATPKAVKDAKDGLSAQIGILSGLNTTAKDNLVNAVNELFTFANDGKSKWSSVIGSPLASSDTFTQMQTKTQTIKDVLADNLTAKGQTSTGAETLTSLVNKVSAIVPGRPIASGETTVSSTSLNINGLSFKPKSLFLFGSLNSSIGGVMIYSDEIVPYKSNANGWYVEGDYSNMTPMFKTTMGNLIHQLAAVSLSQGAASITNLPNRKYRWVLVG